MNISFKKFLYTFLFFTHFFLQAASSDAVLIISNAGIVGGSVGAAMSTGVGAGSPAAAPRVHTQVVRQSPFGSAFEDQRAQRTDPKGDADGVKLPTDTLSIKSPAKANRKLLLSRNDTGKSDVGKYERVPSPASGRGSPLLSSTSSPRDSRPGTPPNARIDFSKVVLAEQIAARRRAGGITVSVAAVAAAATASGNMQRIVAPGVGGASLQASGSSGGSTSSGAMAAGPFVTIEDGATPPSQLSSPSSGGGKWFPSVPVARQFPRSPGESLRGRHHRVKSTVQLTRRFDPERPGRGPGVIRRNSVPDALHPIDIASTSASSPSVSGHASPIIGTSSPALANVSATSSMQSASASAAEAAAVSSAASSPSIGAAVVKSVHAALSKNLGSPYMGSRRERSVSFTEQNTSSATVSPAGGGGRESTAFSPATMRPRRAIHVQEAPASGFGLLTPPHSSPNNKTATSGKTSSFNGNYAPRDFLAKMTSAGTSGSASSTPAASTPSTKHHSPDRSKQSEARTLAGIPLSESIGGPFTTWSGASFSSAAAASSASTSASTSSLYEPHGFDTIGGSSSDDFIG